LAIETLVLNNRILTLAKKLRGSKRIPFRKVQKPSTERRLKSKQLGEEG